MRELARSKPLCAWFTGEILILARQQDYCSFKFLHSSSHETTHEFLSFLGSRS